MQHFTCFFLKFVGERSLLLLEYCLAMESLDLISHMPLISLIMLPKQLKYFTFSSCFLSLMICIVNGCLEILITLACSTFIYVV
jgi:hypothetical protein